MIEKLLEFKLAYEVFGIVIGWVVLALYIVCWLIIVFGESRK